MALITVLMASVLYLSACSSPSEQVSTHSRYRCDGGAELEVQYINTTPGESSVDIMLEGEHYLLHQDVSASGARYVAGGLTWWSKGSEGFLQKDGQTIERNCALLGN